MALRVAAFLVAAVLVAAGPAILGGCGSKAEAEAEAAVEAAEKPGDAGKERAARVRRRLASIERKMKKLKRTTPAEHVAYQKIQTAYNAAKVEFESKAIARLNNVTSDVYHKIQLRLKEVETMIRKYPKG